MLSSQQESAVNTQGRAVKVIACPGSGKTRVLVERFRWYLSKGFTPGQICAITFTRKAAQEMRERLGDDAEGAFVGTSTSFSYSIIRRYLDGSLVPADRDDLESLAKVASDLFSDGVKPSVLVDAYLYSEGLDFSLVSKGATEPRIRRLPGCKSLRAFIASNRLLPVELAIKKACKIEKAGFRRLALEYPVVLWDEFQDTSADEWELLHKIAPRHLFVVGDPRQAIYGWRGADPENIHNLEAERHDLSLNFRSFREIVERSNTLFPELKSHAIRKSETPKVDADVLDLETGLSWVMARILEEEPGQVAVLCRTNRQCSFVHELLRGSFDVQRISKKDDPFAATMYRRLYDMARYATSKRQSTWLAYVLVGGGLTSRQMWDTMGTRTPLHETDPLLIELRSLSPASTVGRIAQILGWIVPEEIRTMALEEFVFWYPNRDLQDQLTVEEDSEPPRVVVMTVHAAKGLEFPSVVLPFVCEGGFPVSDRSDIEEERNLFFVAMTRAENRLILLRDEGTTPSRFMEIQGATDG